MNAAALAHSLPADAPELTRMEFEALDGLYLSGAIGADLPASDRGPRVRNTPKPTLHRLAERGLLDCRRDPASMNHLWWLTAQGLNAVAQRRRRGYA